MGWSRIKKVTEAMFRLEKDLDIPLIATNDSHYIEDQDSRAHEVLLCVQTAGSMNDPKRFKFDTQEFYIKSAERCTGSSRMRPRSARGPCSFRSAVRWSWRR